MNTLKSKGFIVLSLSIAFLTAILMFIYVSYFKFFTRTDDAYVTGNIIHLNSQISGHVKSVFVDDTYQVKKGQLLVSLEPSDAILDVEKTKAALADEVRYVCSLIQEIKQTQSLIEAKKASVTRANYDYCNRKQVAMLGSISKEEFEHAQTTLAFATAELLAEKFHLKILEAKLMNSTPDNHPRVELAKTRYKEALLKLRRCQIFSPCDGIIAQRSVQVGKTIIPEETLLAVVPLDQIWLVANFKETQLKHLRNGQNVEFSADMWGKDIKFFGQIVGQNPGSGAVFAPVPPQNATGNWIKIVQRIPVRIEFDIKQLNSHPLWLGLTCNVKVDIRNQNLNIISQKQEMKEPYQTDIFDSLLDGYEAQIQAVISQNMSLL